MIKKYDYEFSRERDCTECGRIYLTYNPVPGICGECKKRIKKESRRNSFRGNY